MQYTYVDTAFSGTTAATPLDAQAVQGTDVRLLKKIFVGKPTAGATLIVYNDNNAYFGSTTNIAFKYTYPTFASGTPASDQFDFGSVQGGVSGGSSPRDGLALFGGGSVTTSSAMQVTFLWDNPDA